MPKKNPASSMATEQLVKTVCHLCYCQCGMNVYVREGAITRIEGMAEHPLSQGYLCVKGRHAIDFVYSKDRLLYPMKKEDGKWNQITWEEAIDIIASKLTEIREKYGAASFASCVGELMESIPPTGAHLVWRFMDVYGSLNAFTVGQCYKARVQAQNLTYGLLAHRTENPREAKCIILWGHNPYNSEPTTALQVDEARRNGAKLIVIDPRRIPPAQKADIFVQIRPGTDGALILAIINVIISEGLYDHEFVENWTIGFDKLTEHIKNYPLEEVEKITGIPMQKTREIARMYATNKPACILPGLNTLDQSATGFQNSRAIYILQAITGNVDIPGGLTETAMIPINYLRFPEKWGDLPRALGADDYPLFSDMWGIYINSTSSPIVWVDAILKEKPYPVKAMIVAGANPMMSVPNTNRVRQALEKLDFLVVMDIFMTDTAEMADIVLPASTFFERTEIVHADYHFMMGIPYAMLRKPVIEQVGESRPDWKFWIELAKKMGYGADFPWQNVDELIDYYLEPSGITVKQLKDNPSGVECGMVKDMEYFKNHPEEQRFPTPSGKVELYCETIEQMGYDPLPSYAEPLESPFSSPELAKEYPFILTTGARLMEYKHSRYRNIPELLERMPEAVAEIHPESASKYGIDDGDMVIVSTRRGDLDIRVKVTEDIMCGIVSIPHGWVQANVNILTDDTPACSVSGYPSLKSMLCKVQKKVGT